MTGKIIFPIWPCTYTVHMKMSARDIKMQILICFPYKKYINKGHCLDLNML